MLPAAACTTTPSPGRRRTRPHPSRPRRLQPQASAHTSITAGYRKLSRTRPQSQSSPCSRNLETSALPASRRRQVGYLIGRRLAGHRLESTHHSVAGSRPRPASRHLPRPRDQGFSRFPYCYSVPRFAQGKGESGAARRGAPGYRGWRRILSAVRGRAPLRDARRRLRGPAVRPSRLRASALLRSVRGPASRRAAARVCDPAIPHLSSLHDRASPPARSSPAVRACSLFFSSHRHPPISSALFVSK